MTWLYIPAEIGDRITVLCTAHYKISDCDCPLRDACNRPNDPDKTDAENTRTWEEGMAAALLAFENHV